jgi:hypothetical protein
VKRLYLRRFPRKNKETKRGSLCQENAIGLLNIPAPQNGKRKPGRVHVRRFFMCAGFLRALQKQCKINGQLDFRRIGMQVKTLAAAFGVALALGVGQAAQAQAPAQESPFPTDKPYRIKIGGFIPQDSDTRNALGQNFLSFGLGYDFKKAFFVLPVTFEAYVDYFDRVKNTGTFGRSQGRVLGGGVHARYNLDPEATGYRPYFGVGLGLYTGYVKQTQFVAGFGTLDANQRRTTLGGKFTLGAETRGALFGEIGYDFLPHPSIFGEDVALSGYQARIGFKF